MGLTCREVRYRSGVVGGQSWRDSQARRCRMCELTWFVFGLVHVAGQVVQPKVLQTSAYAEVVFTSRGRTAWQTADGASERLARQAALAEPGRKWVLIQTEGALDWCIRDATLMAEQIDHINGVNRLPNVRIGVIVRRAPASVLAPHGFHIFDSRVVQLGTKTATALINKREDIDTYEALWSELERMAIWGNGARAVFERIAEEYRSPAQ